MCTRRLRRLLFRAGKVAPAPTFEEAFDELQSAEETYGVLDRKYEAQWHALTAKVKRSADEGQPQSVLKSLLRRRMLLARRREQILRQKDQLFQKRLHLEQVSLTASHASGLRAVLGVCREMAKGLDCDEVDEMVQEMGELSDAVNETQQVLDESDTVELDEEKLEQELREIQSIPAVRPRTVSQGDEPRLSLLALAKAPSTVPTQRTRLLPAHRGQMVAH